MFYVHVEMYILWFLGGALYICQLYPINCVIQIFYMLADFLSGILPVDEKGMKFAKGNCGFVYFAFELYQFFMVYFEGLV